MEPSVPGFICPSLIQIAACLNLNISVVTMRGPFAYSRRIDDNSPLSFVFVYWKIYEASVSFQVLVSDIIQKLAESRAI